MREEGCVVKCELTMRESLYVSKLEIRFHALYDKIKRIKRFRKDGRSS
jgi:hypothetical protein